MLDSGEKAGSGFRYKKFEYAGKNSNNKLFPCVLLPLVFKVAPKQIVPLKFVLCTRRIDIPIDIAKIEYIRVHLLVSILILINF